MKDTTQENLDPREDERKEQEAKQEKLRNAESLDAAAAAGQGAAGQGDEGRSIDAERWYCQGANLGDSYRPLWNDSEANVAWSFHSETGR